AAVLSKYLCVMDLRSCIQEVARLTTSNVFIQSVNSLGMAVCVARVAPSQLSAVLRRTKYFADRQLDDAGCYQLADLQIDWLGNAAGPDRICRTDSTIHSGSDRRSLGRST